MNEQPRTIRTKNMIIAVLVGMMTITLAILISIILEFGIVANLVMSWIFTTFYALFTFFLVDPIVRVNPVRIIERPVYHDIIKTVEKPVYRDVIKVVEKPVIKEIQIPMENKTIEVVEKEVIREVPVDRIVYRTLEKPHVRLNIPKFKFIGSTQTKTYHKRTCKFSKMLKNKYKLHSNGKALFKRKHFKACKECI